MNELEFYDGTWSGQEIDAGIGLTGALSSALAFVVDGNKSSVSIAVGKYVFVKNSTISGVSDGLYTAAQAIPANYAIDAAYLTAVIGGGLNAVGGGSTGTFFTLPGNSTQTVTLSPTLSVWIMAVGNPGNAQLMGLYVLAPGNTTDTGQAYKVGGTTYLTASVSGSTLTLRCTTSASIRIGLICIS